MVVLKNWIIYALVMLLTSRTTFTQQEVETAKKIPWDKRQAALSQINNWQVNGKIAMQTPDHSGSATVNWIERGEQYDVSLYGPLGSEAISLKGRLGKVVLITADGKHFTAKTPEELVAKQWGFRLPVSHLKYWIRGLPVPHIPYQSQFDAFNRLASVTQAGATIRFLSYTGAPGIDLPSNLSITSPSLKIKIIIYQWNIH